MFWAIIHLLVFSHEGACAPTYRDRLTTKITTLGNLDF